jgi:hypothetical protein
MTLFLRLLLLLGFVTSATAAEPLRVMSFNVRYATAADGDNAWTKRTDLFFATIAAYAPDLIGFQEVVAVQHDALTARLTDYAFSGVARDDGQRKGEWSCIGYRKARFTAVAEGNFWLSETPEVIGSKSWDAALTRICSWVRLRETATGKEFSDQFEAARAADEWRQTQSAESTWTATGASRGRRQKTAPSRCSWRKTGAARCWCWRRRAES